ncbi:MAG: rod shape-determining protein MreD, partial [Bacillota bacterium]
IIAYLIIAMQLALGDILAWRGASPNLVLSVVIFTTMHAKREEGLLGAFILGVLQDLVSQQPAGLYAFSYGLVGLFVVGARPSVYRDHPLTHLFITLAGGLLTGAIILLNEWAYPVLHTVTGWPQPSVLGFVYGACYSAILAVPLMGMLARIKPAFGFRVVRGYMVGGRNSESVG